MGREHTRSSPWVHRTDPAFPHAMVLTVSSVILCLPNLAECANGRFLPTARRWICARSCSKALESLTGSVGQIRCLPQPEQLQGLRARTEQGRELDDGTKRSRCRRYRRRQGQGGCVHSLAVVRANVPKHTTGATSADVVASPAQGGQGGD